MTELGVVLKFKVGQDAYFWEYDFDLCKNIIIQTKVERIEIDEFNHIYYECYNYKIGKKMLYNNYTLFSTKAQAEHYLKNANVTRTEKLPYITWEEFKKEKYFNFIDEKTRIVEIKASSSFKKIYIIIDDFIEYEWIATEENFYKAYEVARKLFLGEE